MDEWINRMDFPISHEWSDTGEAGRIYADLVYRRIFLLFYTMGKAEASDLAQKFLIVNPHVFIP